jgi:hypothetical protein
MARKRRLAQAGALENTRCPVAQPPILSAGIPVSGYNRGVEIAFGPRKSEYNLRLRGFGFEMTSEFDFGSAIYTTDTRKDYGEVRVQALGFIGDTLYALVFTMRGDALRVISLRRASRKERNRYEKARS